MNRIFLLDVGLDPMPLSAVLARLKAAVEQRAPLQVVTVNVDFLAIRLRNPKFGDTINQAGLSLTDGRILLWLTRLAGTPAPEQITGHDLLRVCAQLAAEQGQKILLLGGGPRVAERAAAVLRQRHPGLTVAGLEHGYFRPDGTTENEASLLEQIRGFGPDYLFVALGAPKQDFWIERNLARLGVPVAVGVGCVFDVLVGDIPRAPLLLQRLGLESVFQALIEPRRYAIRYIRHDVPVTAKVAFWAIKRRFGAARA